MHAVQLTRADCLEYHAQSKGQAGRVTCMYNSTTMLYIVYTIIAKYITVEQLEMAL